MDLAGDEVDAGQQADRAVTFIFMLTCEGHDRLVGLCMRLQM
jgi:hypothetical protein